MRDRMSSSPAARRRGRSSWSRSGLAAQDLGEVAQHPRRRAPDVIAGPGIDVEEALLAFPDAAFGAPAVGIEEEAERNLEDVGNLERIRHQGDRRHDET